MTAITPFLWLDDHAEEAAAFYCSIFPSSRTVSVQRYGEGGPGTPGSVMTVHFELDGHPFIALNGAPVRYEFDEAISFVIDCADQAEVDRYWVALTDGGEAIACGWLKDRYGLRWQVVPRELHELLADPDPGRAQRATQAMLQMTKLDVAALRAAADAT